jgi:hypothetical protein
MTQQITGNPKAKEMLRQLKDYGANVYRAAYENGTSLSVHLEEIDPSTQYPNSRLDAFERLMAEAGIRTHSNLTAGYYASTYEQFAKHPEARALLPEWWAREWRKAQTGNSPNTRAVWDYGDSAAGSSLRPYVEEAMGQWNQRIAPAIPLAELVAMTVPIERPDYRAHYLTYAAADLRMGRVEPGTDIPLAKLTSGDRTIQAHKYGRALRATYEQLRFQRLDEIAMAIQMMAIQAEVDKVAAAINVLISGDGNDGTSATSYNLTTLDTDATAGTLTLAGWLSFLFQFQNPYMATTALIRDNIAIQMLLLNMGNANIPMLMMLNQPGMTSFTNINQTADNIRLGRTSEAPANKVVAFDRRLALKRLTVIGADIQEVERFILNQTEVMTMTEMEAFAIIDANATKILDVNA